MKNELKDKILQLLNFFDLKEENISFNKDFNIYLVSIKSNNFYNNDFCFYLEYLIHQITPKEVFIKVDLNNTFLKKLESIKDEVNTVFNQAKYYNKPIGFKPKNAFERRLVHIYIDSIYNVRHESIGEGESRQIIIYPN